MGIAVAIVITATAAKYSAAEGNVSARQLLIRLGDSTEPMVPKRTTAQVEQARSAVARLAAESDGAAVVSLDVAVDPAAPECRGGEVVHPVVVLGRRVGANTRRDVGVLYVATPELLQHYGLDPSRVGPTTDVLTVRTGDLAFVNVFDRSARPPNVKPIDLPAYSSAPSSFITRDALRRHGWEEAPFGWLVESSRPFTSAQVAKARSLAADAGLTVEARREQRSLSVIGIGATAAGILLALGVLAMTVGLIRSEAAGDLRTLTAAGATSMARRVLTAATAGALALLGALLGTVGAYLALIAGYWSDLGALSRVPVVDLLAIVVGLPLIATAAGWSLAGREPPALARQPLP